MKPTLQLLAPYAPPGLGHVFGADALGRSFAPLLVSGIASTILDVVLASIIAVAVAILLASLGSVYRGRYARFVLGLAAAFSFSTPLIAVLLLLYGTFGDRRIIFPAVCGFLLWGNATLTIQTAIARAWASPYVRAARSMGVTRFAILRIHLLPNIVGPLFAAWVANWPMMISVSVLVSFLGAKGPEVNLGSLLKTGYEIFPSCWWLWSFPTAAVCLVTFLFYALAWSTALTTKSR
jgi:ABC-type dipeptide/oligopeptide/nickel transport system permease subunit